MLETRVRRELDKGILEDLQRRRPFLKALPHFLLERLNFDEMAYPGDELLAFIEQTEQYLGHHVMPFLAADIDLRVPLTSHLSSMLAPAPLGDQEIAFLEEMERQMASTGVSVSFGVYHRPRINERWVEFVHPLDTSLGQQYARQGLISGEELALLSDWWNIVPRIGQYGR